MKNSADTQVTNCETIENNKLIAEFMGLREESGDLILTLGNDEWYIDLSDEDTFKFDYDWNWLMPAVEKILNLKDTYAQERQRVFNSISPDINITYTAVISFIKWYNENK